MTDTMTFKIAAVPHKYRNRFLKDSGTAAVISEGAGSEGSQFVLTKAAIEAKLTGDIDTHTHDGRYYTETEVDNKLTGKQDNITDLPTIRSNAEKGAAAHGWGNHASEGYLKNESDPIWTAWLASDTGTKLLALLAILSLEDNNKTLKIDADTYATGGLTAFGKGTNEIVDNTARAAAAAAQTAADKAQTAADKAQTDATSALTQLNGMIKIQKVSEMPSNPDANTLYIVV